MTDYNSNLPPLEKRPIPKTAMGNNPPSKIDPLPALVVLGQHSVLAKDANVYSGTDTGKSVIESHKKGESVLVLGKAIDQPWLIIGRDNKAIGYMPADSIVQPQHKVKKLPAPKSGGF